MVHNHKAHRRPTVVIVPIVLPLIAPMLCPHHPAVLVFNAVAKGAEIYTSDNNE